MLHDQVNASASAAQGHAFFTLLSSRDGGGGHCFLRRISPREKGAGRCASSRATTRPCGQTPLLRARTGQDRAGRGSVGGQLRSWRCHGDSSSYARLVHKDGKDRHCDGRCSKWPPPPPQDQTCLLRMCSTCCIGAVHGLVHKDSKHRHCNGRCLKWMRRPRPNPPPVHLLRLLYSGHPWLVVTADGQVRWLDRKSVV